MAEELQTGEVTEVEKPVTESQNVHATEKPAAPAPRSDVIREALKGAAERADGRKTREHGPDGKFLPRTEKPSAAPETTPVAAGSSPVVPGAAEPKTLASVPGGLQAHLKLKWNDLSPEWQEELARLDKTGADAGNKFAPQVQFAREIQNEIQPYEAMIRAEGGTPATAIRSLFQTAALLRTGTQAQKQQAVMQIMQTYGVQLPQGQQQGQEGTPPMPDIAQHPYVQQLATQVSQLTGHLTQQQQREQQQREAANANAVNAFLSESANGVPKYPIDPTLEEPFAQRIAFVRSNHPDWDSRRVLEQAYEDLSWTQPNLRTVLLSRQEAERQAKNAQELEKKKAAAVQVRGGPSPATLAKPNATDRRELIKRELAARSS